jgi:hypothetical protein
MADGGGGEQGLRAGDEFFFELVEEGISEFPVPVPSGAEGVMFRNKLKPEWHIDRPVKRKNQKQISWAYDHCRAISDKHPDYKQ